MLAKTQLNLFEEQVELFPAAPAVAHPDPDRIRRRLARIITEARAAETMPWDRNQRRLYEQVVPQMSLALPEEEAAQFRLDFAREMERLG
ncbi:MAG TPA: hypothetical protein VHB74_03025 [Devosia sp.]|nr:hypothetical protein [Devosia sp.]